MNCENCNLKHDGNYGSGRFCCLKCARCFSTKSKRLEINNKVSETMMKRPDKLNCKICNNEFKPSHIREVCCSKECKNKNKKESQIHLTKEKRAKSSAKASKGKYKRNPQSILDLSSRTVSKIIQRLEIGCSRCKWNEATGDIHHINGRNIPNADNHSNLTYLCPNCHRLFHYK